MDTVKSIPASTSISEAALGYSFCVTGGHGQPLVEIKPNGEVISGGPVEASEAGKIFVASIRQHLALDQAKAVSEGAFRMGARAMRDAIEARITKLCDDRQDAQRPHGTTNIIAAVIPIARGVPIPEFFAQPAAKPAEWAWWAGLDEEWYTAGPFMTRDDAVEAGAGEFDGEAFNIVEALAGAFRFEASVLIEEQYFESQDFFDGERTEPDRIGGTDVIKAADAELQALLDGWLDRWRQTFVAPSLFAATRNHEVVPATAFEPETGE